MCAPHLQAVIDGASSLDLKLIARYLFWSCFVYSMLVSLWNSNFEGKCCYCNKGVYCGHHRIEFDWEEKTERSQATVSLHKVAHFSCHENAPPEKKFDFPNEKGSEN
jgi:hypothetical protein